MYEVGVIWKLDLLMDICEQSFAFIFPLWNTAAFILGSHCRIWHLLTPWSNLGNSHTLMGETSERY